MSSSASSDEEHEENDTDERRSGQPVVPERKAKSLTVCDDSKSRPNNVATLQQTCPSLPRAEAEEPGQGQQRKPSLSSTTSLPLPQRSLSQGESAAPPKHVKPLQRCPTLNNSKTNSDQKANGSTPSSTSTNNGNAVKAEPPAQGPGGTPKRKESVSWSPFGAIGKAVSSGVNIVGDATKAVGTGVVQGTKAVGSGVVSGTKVVGSGVVSVGSGVVKTATAVGDGVIEGTKVVGTGIVDVTEMTASAAVSGAKAVGSATVSTVNATVDETSSFVREKKKSVNRHMRRTMSYSVVEGDTLGIIAAKYKTTCEDLIELNPQLADRRVQHGEEIRVPIGGSRKMSKTKDSANFLQGLSMSFLEDDDMEGVEMAETRCLINSNASYGPKTVTAGYLILDSSQLSLSWGREDPITLSSEDIVNIALVYGPLELAEFVPLLDNSTGHSVSEPEVFPVYDEEAELELDSCSTDDHRSYGTDDHSPYMQQVHDPEDEASLNGYNRNNSVEGPSEAHTDDGQADTAGADKQNQGSDLTDDGPLGEDKKLLQREKTRSTEDEEFHPEGSENQQRKFSRGRRASRKRTISKERRQSLLYEDQMATYCYVEVAEGFIPATKSTAVLQEDNTNTATSVSPVEVVKLPSSGSVDMPVSPHWNLTNITPSFIIRVPNESIIRMFSFLIRNYETKYGSMELPFEANLGFSMLNMDTLQTKCGEAKIGAKLNSSIDGESEDLENEHNGEPHQPLPHLYGESSILEEEDISQLQERLPTRLENHAWTLAFTTSNDGFALSTLYRKVQDLDCPILMVIQDVDQVIFGGLLSEPPKVTDSFCGTGESWLFSISTDTGDLSVFKWTTANQLFIKGSNEQLVIGAGGGQFGLWFDGDLNKGRTQRCETFDNPPLTPSSDFCVYCLECWAFLPST